MNKINFKQPKYILPLILFPFVVMGGYFVNGFQQSLGSKKTQSKLTERTDISTDLGGNQNVEIKNKTDAYSEFYDKRTDGRTMIGGIEEESDFLNEYDDSLSDEEKRFVDSLNLVKQRNRLKQVSSDARSQQKYYQENNRNSGDSKSREDEQYDRSMKMLDLMNNRNAQREQEREVEPRNEAKEWKDEQLSLMRQQMAMLDSIEKGKDPEIMAQMKAQERLKADKEELDFFMNSSLSVRKSSKNASFNSVYKTKESSFIKAVIDENIKGFLGSRIRIRLLEDVYVGNIKMKAGTPLYALISGFSLQRVNLNIVSVMYQNEILPINLNIYDVDGMEGLYVPSSSFREMTRTLGQNVVQGQNLNMTGNDFFANSVTSIFQSTSKTIAELIRKNKVKVKYNSFVYLVDNKELQQKKQTIYKNSKN